MRTFIARHPHPAGRPPEPRRPTEGARPARNEIVRALARAAVGGPPHPTAPFRPSPAARGFGKIANVHRPPPPPRGAPPRAPATHGRGAWGLRTPSPICSPSPYIAIPVPFFFSQCWRRIEFAKFFFRWEWVGRRGASRRESMRLRVRVTWSASHQLKTARAPLADQPIMTILHEEL